LEEDTLLSGIAKEGFELLLMIISWFPHINELLDGSNDFSRSESENYHKIHSIVLLLRLLSEISSDSDEG
jgi:hypothetical protein